jgi:anion-transporting  ArsA/GET3 family ATPase
MADFFTSRFLRLLTVPYQSRFVNYASRPFYQLADRILGSQFLEDIAEFFILFQSMYDGFVQRANAVTRLLHDKRTTFVVVSTLESAPLHEAEFFVSALADKKFHLGALVLNKVLPSYLADDTAGALAERLSGDVAGLAPSAAEAAGLDAPDVAQVERVLHEVGESFRNFSVVAKREAEQKSELARSSQLIVTVPYFETDIYDLSGLVRLGEKLWG